MAIIPSPSTTLRLTDRVLSLHGYYTLTVHHTTTDWQGSLTTWLLYPHHPPPYDWLTGFSHYMAIIPSPSTTLRLTDRVLSLHGYYTLTVHYSTTDWQGSLTTWLLYPHRPPPYDWLTGFSHYMAIITSPSTTLRLTDKVLSLHGYYNLTVHYTTTDWQGSLTTWLLYPHRPPPYDWLTGFSHYMAIIPSPSTTLRLTDRVLSLHGYYTLTVHYSTTDWQGSLTTWLLYPHRPPPYDWLTGFSHYMAIITSPSTTLRLTDKVLSLHGYYNLTVHYTTTDWQGSLTTWLLYPHRPPPYDWLTGFSHYMAIITSPSTTLRLTDRVLSLHGYYNLTVHYSTTDWQGSLTTWLLYPHRPLLYDWMTGSSHYMAIIPSPSTTLRLTDRVLSLHGYYTLTVHYSTTDWQGSLTTWLLYPHRPLLYDWLTGSSHYMAIIPSPSTTLRLTDRVLSLHGYYTLTVHYSTTDWQGSLTTWLLYPHCPLLYDWLTGFSHYMAIIPSLSTTLRLTDRVLSLHGYYTLTVHYSTTDWQGPLTTWLLQPHCPLLYDWLTGFSHYMAITTSLSTVTDRVLSLHGYYNLTVHYTTTDWQGSLTTWLL